MINGKLYNTSKVKYQNVDVLSCRPALLPRVIIANTLGGEWFVQTVGTAASKAAVSLRVMGETARQAIQTLWSTGGAFIVTYDSLSRTGFILDEPAYELLTRAENPDARQYSMSFTFAITAEEALA